MDNCLSAKRQIDSIDVLKYILSVLIIAYHTSIFTDIDYNVSRIIRLFTNTATGSFFVISGYLLGIRSFSNTEQAERLSVALKSAKRLILLWAVWELIYTPFILYKTRTGASLSEILVSDYLLGSYAHLWYLKASAIAVIMVWVAKKAGFSNRLLAALACLLYLVGAYMLSIEHNTAYRNGFFFSFPYYILGMLIAEKQDLISRLPVGKLLACCAAAIAAYIAENCFIWTGQSSFTMPFACAAILVVFLRFRIDLSADKAKLFRNISTLNYTIHYGIFSILSHFNRSGAIAVNSVELFCTILLITTALAFLVIAGQKKLAFLRILY